MKVPKNYLHGEPPAPCVESAPHGRCELAAAGSAKPPVSLQQHVPTTQKITKPQDTQETSQQKDIDVKNALELQYKQFFHSGAAAFMKDQQAALSMLEKAISVIYSGTGKFAFLYTKDLDVKYSCFEENPNFTFWEHRGTGASAEVSAYVDEKKFSFVRKRMKVQCFRKEEVEMMLKLDHPGVCKVLAVLCYGNTIDLLLQDAGYPLKQVLQNGMTDCQYQKVMVDLGRQGFKILHYIHQQGVCHLDIKPENLLVHRSKEGGLVLVLADFGSSRYVGDTMTSDQTTPEYWSAEMWCNFTRYLPQTLQAASLPRTEQDKLLAMPEKGKFVARPEIDTTAMGMVLYFIGTQKHFILAEHDFPEPAVPPEEVEMLCRESHNKLERKNAFNLLLMTKYRWRVPDLTTRGRWVCNSVPPTVQEVIRGTLNPDPEQRLTDRQAVSFLSGQSRVVSEDTSHSIHGEKREVCIQDRTEPNTRIPGNTSQYTGCQPSQDTHLNIPIPVDTEFSVLQNQELLALEPSAVESFASEPPALFPSVQLLAEEPPALLPSVQFLAMLPPSLQPLAVEPAVEPLAPKPESKPVHTPNITPVGMSVKIPVQKATSTYIQQANLTLRTNSPHATTCVAQQQGQDQILRLDDLQEAEGQKVYLDDQYQGQGHLCDQGNFHRFHLDNKGVGSWPDMEGGEADGDDGMDYDVELDEGKVVGAHHNGVPDAGPLTLVGQSAEDKVKGLIHHTPENPWSDNPVSSSRADITNTMYTLSLKSPLPNPPLLPSHEAAGPVRKKGSEGSTSRPVLKARKGVRVKPVDQSPSSNSGRKRSLSSSKKGDPPSKLMFVVASSGRHKPKPHALPLPPSSSSVQPVMDNSLAYIQQPKMAAGFSFPASNAAKAGEVEDPPDQAQLVELHELLEKSHFYAAVGDQLGLFGSTVDQSGIDKLNLTGPVQGCTDPPPHSQELKLDPPHSIQEYIGPHLAGLNQRWAEPHMLDPSHRGVKPDPPPRSQELELDPPHSIQEYIGPHLAGPNQRWAEPHMLHPSHRGVKPDDPLLRMRLFGQDEKGPLDLQGTERNLPNFDMIVGSAPNLSG